MKMEMEMEFLKLGLSIQIVIHWPDEHISRFKPDFFHKYGPGGSSGDYQGYFSHKNQKEFWYGDHTIGRHNFVDIKNSNEAQFDYLQGIVRSGVILRYQTSFPYIVMP